MSSKGTRAVIYRRISQDREGTEVGVENQQAACMDLAEKLKLSVVGVFSDNNIGASTRSRRERPGFSSMLAAAKRGEFDTIVAYSNSRLTRRPKEFELLIDLHREHGVTIRTVVSGDDDLSTADGRMTARIKAAADAGEAERTGERVAFAQAAKLASGQDIGGRRPFGFEDDRVAIREEEAALIRLAAQMIIERGATLYGVARAWDESGIRAQKWRSQTVRDILIRPRNAGRLTVGGVDYPRGDRPAILTDEQQRQVLAALALNEKPKRGPKPQTATAVTVVRCGVCGARCELTVKAGVRYVRCSVRGGGVRHPTMVDHSLDRQLAELALALTVGSTTATSSRSDISEARTALAELTAKRDRAREDVDAYDEPEDREHARARVADLTREITRARIALDAALNADTSVAALEIARDAVRDFGDFDHFEPATVWPEWERWWKEQPVSARRSLLRALTSSIELMPAVTGKPWRLRVDGEAQPVASMGEPF